MKPYVIIDSYPVNWDNMKKRIFFLIIVLPVLTNAISLTNHKNTNKITIMFNIGIDLNLMWKIQKKYTVFRKKNIN